MLWLFVAVCLLSAGLFIDASYRSPNWRRWLFKPVAQLLLLSLAWKASMFNAINYLIFLGLCLSLVGDVLTLLISYQLSLYTVGTLSLSYLLYTFYFISQITLPFIWPLLLALPIVSVPLLTIIWKRIKKVHWPLYIFIAIMIMMVWLAGELWFFSPTISAISSFFGALILLIGNIIWLSIYYWHRLCTNNAIAASCYFAGHFLIVLSLYI